MTKESAAKLCGAATLSKTNKQTIKESYHAITNKSTKKPQVSAASLHDLINQITILEHPYAAWVKTFVHVQSKENALKMPYIYFNGPTQQYVLAIDIDREGAAFDWDGVCAEPNCVCINKENNHCMYLYFLAEPVCTSDAGRLKPMQYLSKLEYIYTLLLEGDFGYNGKLHKNPLSDSWLVLKGCPEAYELRELGSFVPDELPKQKKGAKKEKELQTSLQRNNTLFEKTRYWAYRNIKDYDTFDSFFTGCLAKAIVVSENFGAEMHEGKNPFSYSEVQGVAKSVAKWTWKRLNGDQSAYIAKTHTSDKQSERGKVGGIKSGKVRAKKAQKTRKMAVKLKNKGMNITQISQQLSVTRATIYNLLKK